MSINFSLFGGAESLDEGRDGKCKRSPRRTFGAQEQGADRYVYPAPPQDPKDFLWLMTEEPHRTRRMAIMKAHPEVTKLMGHEPLTKYVVFLVVLLQISLAILLRQTSPLSFTFISCAYVIGGTANHNLFLAIHEITHNLAFKGIIPNKLFCYFCQPSHWHSLFCSLQGLPYRPSQIYGPGRHRHRSSNTVRVALLEQHTWENIFLNIPNIILCSATNIRPFPAPHTLALAQHTRSACFRLCSSDYLWHQISRILDHEQFLRWQLASMCGSLYCRALLVGRHGTRDIQLLWTAKCFGL